MRCEGGLDCGDGRGTLRLRMRSAAQRSAARRRRGRLRHAWKCAACVDLRPGLRWPCLSWQRRSCFGSGRNPGVITGGSLHQSGTGTASLISDRNSPFAFSPSSPPRTQSQPQRPRRRRAGHHAPRHPKPGWRIARERFRPRRATTCPALPQLNSLEPLAAPQVAALACLLPLFDVFLVLVLAVPPRFSPLLPIATPAAWRRPSWLPSQPPLPVRRASCYRFFFCLSSPMPPTPTSSTSLRSAMRAMAAAT